MLDKKLFKEKMQDLIDFYPHWKLNVSDKSVMNKWYSRFKNEKEEHFVRAVDDYIENEDYSPTVAKLKDYIPYDPEPTVTQKEVEEFVSRNFK